MRLFLLESTDCPDAWDVFDLTPFGVQPIIIHHELHSEAHVRVADAPCLAHRHQTVLLRDVVEIHVVRHTY